jgi:hypothetical protein
LTEALHRSMLRIALRPNTLDNTELPQYPLQIPLDCSSHFQRDVDLWAIAR